MANNIQAIFDNRWNGGYNAGWNAGVAHVSTNNNTVSMISIGSASNHGGSWTVNDVNLVIILIETPGRTSYSTSVTAATQIYTWQNGDNAYVAWRTTARYQSHTVSVWIDRSEATGVVMCVRY